MNSPQQHEMNKLQAIDHQRAAIQERLEDRLPRQYSQLLALVTVTRWRLTALAHQRPSIYTQELLDTTSKKLRMEVGAFEYAAKEQSEFLTRALFQLDDILSHGDAAIKDTRKALVLSIQQLLERADAFKVKATSLKEFTERMIERLPVVEVAMEEQETAEATEGSVESKTEDTPMKQDDDDWEHVQAEDMRPLFSSLDNVDESEEAQEDAVMVQSDEVENQSLQEEEDEEEEEEEEQEEEEYEQNVEGTTEEAEDESSTDSLPVWRPYYQIQKRPDGVYLVTNLRGVDPRNIQIHAMPQQGILRIAGVKYPTQKDLLLSQLSGAPTFGRFEIVERFPTHMLNLENASRQLSEDGTLQVRLPFYFVQHPRVMRRVSPFQPRGLMVW